MVKFGKTEKKICPRCNRELDMKEQVLSKKLNAVYYLHEQKNCEYYCTIKYNQIDNEIIEIAESPTYINFNFSLKVHVTKNFENGNLVRINNSFSSNSEKDVEHMLRNQLKQQCNVPENFIQFNTHQMIDIPFGFKDPSWKNNQ